MKTFIWLGLIIAAAEAVTLDSSGTQAVNWPTLRDRLNEKYAAMDAEIKDITIQEELHMTVQGGDIAMSATEQRKGIKSRMQSPNFTMICDGQDTWMVMPSGGRRKAASDQVNSSAVGGRLMGRLPEKAEVKGTAEIEGRECYIVEAQDGPGSFFSIMWIAMDDLSLVKAESRKGNTVMTFLYKDFRKICGEWKMAFATEMSSGGTRIMTTIVKSVDVNKGLSDDLFDLSKLQPI